MCIFLISYDIINVPPLCYVPGDSSSECFYIYLTISWSFYEHVIRGMRGILDCTLGCIFYYSHLNAWEYTLTTQLKDA